MQLRLNKKHYKSVEKHIIHQITIKEYFTENYNLSLYYSRLNIH